MIADNMKKQGRLLLEAIYEGHFEGTSHGFRPHRSCHTAFLAALEKKPTDFADFLRLMEESGFAVKQGRGGVISFLAPGQEKPTRLRASTLGAGFDPEDIKAVIAGERPLPELPEEPTVPPRRV